MKRTIATIALAALGLALAPAAAASAAPAKARGSICHYDGAGKIHCNYNKRPDLIRRPPTHRL